MRSQYIIAIVTVIMLGAGCAAKIPNLQRLYQPDLARLYRVSRAEHFQNPVILLHGVFGSKLRNKKTEEIVWPGGLLKMLFGNYNSLALKIDADKLEPKDSGDEAYALFDQAGGVDYYGRILSAFNVAGGYDRGVPGVKNIHGSRQYYVFTYDWRQDIAKTVVELDKLIEQIRLDYAMPDLKVDIVAHSMGALLTRYYIRYGTKDVLDDDTYIPNYIGGEKTRKVILIGAPNLGSISGLQNFLGGVKIGPMKIPVEIMVTMPSAFQLLPHPDRDWMITPDGKKFDRDLYSISTWIIYKWSIFNPSIKARITKRFSDKDEARRYFQTLTKYFKKYLNRARNFHRSLSVPMKRSSVRYVVFGGDCELTPARCLVETVNGKTVIRLKPNQIVNRVPGIDYSKLMLEPGDGRVTKPSLLARNSLDPSISTSASSSFPLAYSVFFCEKHAGLTGNISFQDNMLNILLFQETTEDRMDSGGSAP